MIEGERIILRPVKDEDWPTFETWARFRETFWGPFQRFQLDHLPLLREAYQKNKLLTRDSGFFLIEVKETDQIIGFVRYTLIPFPDTDLPHPEIGYGIPETSSRGKGYAQDAVALLIGYLFAGYPAERISAFTDEENIPSQHVLENLGFAKEGIMQRSTFRDCQWKNIAIYGLLRSNWQTN